MTFIIIEKEWTTDAGLQAIVVMTTFGTRNGYIKTKLPKPLESYYWDVEVHGGITYSGNHPELGEAVGFDCNHAWDAPDWEAADKLFGEDEDYLKHKDSRQAYPPASDTVVRTLDYVVEECESLAKQLKEILWV